MKTPSPLQLRAAAVLVLASLWPASLAAGEAIQFSNARNRSDPTAKSKLPLGKNDDSVGNSPLDYLPPSIERRDPRLTRKDQNAAAERKNWILLDRGQLDAEDEEKRAFGLHDASFEKEEDPDKKDYFFTPRETKDGSSSRLRSQFTRPPSRDQSGGQPREAARDGSDEAQRGAPGKDGQPTGENTAKELDLKDMLSPGKANSLAPAVDKTTLMWREVFGGSGENHADTLRRRDEPSTADSFRGPASFGARRDSDTLTFRKDPVSSSATPAARGFSESVTRSFNAPSVPTAPRAPDGSFSRPPIPYSTPSAADAYNARGGGSAADPYSGFRPPSQPQRTTPGNYQIPSRPGYGGR